MTARRLAAALACLAVAGLPTGLAAADERAADLVFRNGKLYTVDDQVPEASALAVRDGRIFGLGQEADVSRWVGPQTRVVDLHGRLVLPAFHDAHTHPVWGG